MDVWIYLTKTPVQIVMAGPIIIAVITPGNFRNNTKDIISTKKTDILARVAIVIHDK